jgi:hypothetical protein
LRCVEYWFGDGDSRKGRWANPPRWRAPPLSAQQKMFAARNLQVKVVMSLAKIC